MLLKSDGIRSSHHHSYYSCDLHHFIPFLLYWIVNLPKAQKVSCCKHYIHTEAILVIIQKFQIYQGSPPQKKNLDPYFNSFNLNSVYNRLLKFDKIYFQVIEFRERGYF